MSTTSPNMNLIISTVNVDSGLQWETNLNSSLSIIDGHNHTAGSGAPIPVSGLDISSDLPININNVTLVRSVRFSPQSSAISLPADLGCIYEAGVDLYYNDGNGNQVRLTQGGAVAGSTGTITGLPSGTASASYAAGKFTFQSATNTSAVIDAGSYIMRNNTASSFGLTINPPNAMGANYSLTMPALPASQKIMTLDASGNISAPYVVDNSTIEVSSNIIQVKALGIGTAQIANGAVTAAKLAANSVTSATSTGTFFTSSLTAIDVTNASISFSASTGRPVQIYLSADGSGSASQVYTENLTTGISPVGFIYLLRGATVLAKWQVGATFNSYTGTPGAISVAPSVVFFIDQPTTGTYTYKLQAQSTSANVVIGVTNCQFNAIQMA